MHIHQIMLPIQPYPSRWADVGAFFAAVASSIRGIHKKLGSCLKPTSWSTSGRCGFERPLLPKMWIFTFLQALSVGWVEQGETQRQPFVVFKQCWVSLHSTQPTWLSIRHSPISDNFNVNSFFISSTEYMILKLPDYI